MTFKIQDNYSDASTVADTDHEQDLNSTKSAMSNSKGQKTSTMKITKINGKYYDLTNFDHPGGETALWHAYGRDASVLFNSHHALHDQKKLEKLLKIYEIGELPAGVELLPGEEEVEQFEYNTPFSQELKAEVGKVLKAKCGNVGNVKADFYQWCYFWFGITMRVVAFYFYFNCHPLALIVLAPCNWLTAEIMHEAMHFAFSTRPWVNDLVSWLLPDATQPLIWRVQHNILHHFTPNMRDHDPDLHHVEFLIRHTDESPFRPLNEYQGVGFILQWLFFYIHIIIEPTLHLVANASTTLRAWVDPIRNHLLDNDTATRSDFLKHYIVFIVYNTLYFGVPILKLGLVNGLVYALIPKTIFNLWFMLNTQVDHLHDEQVSAPFGTDWYKNQITHSVNFGKSNYSLYRFLTGGLAYQIEHHLFPGVSHCHLKDVHPVVMRICQKHNVPFKEFDGYYDAFHSYYSHVTRLSDVHTAGAHDDNYKCIGAWQ